MSGCRLPAEWEPQSGVMLTWPHGGGDWAERLDRVDRVFLEIARTVSRFEQLLVVCEGPRHTARIRAHCLAAGVDPEAILWAESPSDDIWARDHGPITVFRNGAPLLLDFRFDGWGKKYPAARDNGINGRLHRAGVFGDTPLRAVDLVLEGGAIESDGRGTLLLHAPCLLDPVRNPGIERGAVETVLRQHLGARRFLWLDGCTLAGDDTDGHVDTLARFGDRRTILYQGCLERAHPQFQALERLERQLLAFTGAGSSFRLVKLPSPAPLSDAGGRPLPAGYANFLIINGAVLVPAYDDPADREAIEKLAACFPGREVVAVDARPLIEQSGSLHCVAMQLPAGVL